MINKTFKNEAFSIETYRFSLVGVIFKTLLYIILTTFNNKSIKLFEISEYMGTTLHYSKPNNIQYYKIL